MRVSPSSETFPLRQSGYSTEWQHTYTHHHLHTHLCSHYPATSTQSSSRWGTPIHKMVKNAWWNVFFGGVTPEKVTHILLYRLQDITPPGRTWSCWKHTRRSEGVWPLLTEGGMYKMSGQHGHTWNTWQAHWGHSYTNVDTLHKCCKCVISLPPTLIDPRQLPKCVPLDMLFTPDLWTAMN